MRVLVVDDNVELLDLLAQSLQRDQHEVLRATTVEAAREVLANERVELLVLDLGLPDGSGLLLCRSLRAAGSTLPVLVLTAQTAVSSRVACLDAGADDHLGKPFAVAELRARVRALGRRARPSRRAPFRHRDCELDFSSRRATLAGSVQPITAREWELLEVLAAQPGELVSREDLLQAAWGRNDDSAWATLEVLVSRIRKKLGPELVRTVRGEGYMMGHE